MEALNINNLVENDNNEHSDDRSMSVVSHSYSVASMSAAKNSRLPFLIGTKAFFDEEYIGNNFVFLYI